MGRLENFKQRGRNRKNKRENPFIVIACEGKTNKTERKYFENFSSRNCIVRFSNGSSTDPIGIVEDLINFIDNEIGRVENDKYYAVFDTDLNKNIQSQIEEAKELARNNGVEIITSTPTFEFWYILHYGYTTKNYVSSDDVQNDIKTQIENYSKNMNVYPILRDKTEDAINNAKKVEKYHLELGQALDNENCNPYTSVYKIVEELNRRNKN